MIDSSDQATANDVVDNYDQYHSDNPFEICSILKGLIVKPDVVTAYYDSTMENFILTSVIDVNVKKKTFILDISSDLERNQLVLLSDKLVCKTKCKNIQVEFTLGKIKSITHNGSEAFLCNVPNTILYLQRRDFYRLTIPLGDKISCKIPGSSSIELVDISTGGIGINQKDLSISHELFECSYRCEIDFGEIGIITFGIELKSKRKIKLHNNTDAIKLGYKFIDLQTPDNAKIQRYIHSVDVRKKQSQ